MAGKITLITPPDFFETLNPGILFVHLNAEEQDAVSKWLGTHDIEEDINFYVFEGEPNVPWFFHAVAVCEHKYINLDDVNFITGALSGYVLGKGNFCYKTSNDNLASIYSFINGNRVTHIEQFLERVFGVQTNNNP